MTAIIALHYINCRTGYSKAAEGARKVTTEDDVAEDFYHFMQSFLTVRTVQHLTYYSPLLFSSLSASLQSLYTALQLNVLSITEMSHTS